MLTATFRGPADKASLSTTRWLIKARRTRYRGFMSEVRCELCDLPVTQCQHGRAAQHRPSVPQQLEVSPARKAHFPGCPHKGDDKDLSRWGLITTGTAAAWQALGNGQVAVTDAGSQVGLIANARCTTCDSHGAWL